MFGAYIQLTFRVERGFTDMMRKGGMFHFADGTDKLLLLFGTLGCIGDGLMSPLTMVILGGIIDDYGSGDLTFSNDVVDKYALKLLILAIGVAVSAFIEGICWTRTAERQTSRLRIEYLKSVLRQEVSFFDTQVGSSTNFEVISAISGDAQLIQDVMADKIPNCLAHLSALVFSIIVSFILSWRLAVASLPFALLFVVPVLGFGASLQGLGMKMKDAYDTGGGVAEHAISSIRTVYSYVGEHQTINKFSHALQTSMALGIKQGFTKGLMIGSMGMVFVAWAFISWVGSYLVTEKGETGGRVFVSAICVIMAGLSAMSALPNVTFISEAIAATKRMFKMISRVPLIDSDNWTGKTIASVRGDIEFRGVDFSYPSRPDTPILQKLNLKVKAGKTIGLVGSSGSGKSTIISLLERFYDPVKGDILLDGHRLKGFQLKWLRSQMGLVNQEPVLFATSIKENILFGKEGVSAEMVEIAAKAANAHDFIIKLPDAYETQVGQFGIQLSGGQKQRIAIARALLKEPRILLLDEATSALDTKSERVVQEALDQASIGRTTIIVAHRLTTIRKADKIVVLWSGKVIESGTHDELMHKNNKKEGGAYYQMVLLQQSATHNESGSPDSLYPPIRQQPHGRDFNPQFARSPIGARSSLQNSPMSPFCPTVIMSMAHSVQMYSYQESDGEYLSDIPDRSPSQWRLLQMNAPEWKRAFLGCLGATGFGAISPIHAYCLGSVVSVYFLPDKAKVKSDTAFYCIIFVVLGVVCFVANLLQHYNFAVMGERLTKRVREKMLGNILTFEVGWFDKDENTSAAICARLATEASLIRSLVGDRISLLLQVFVSAFLAFIIALIITWRVAIVMISVQPLLIASFYSKTVLMKSMSTKAKKAQNEGTQLASEAVVNHRTITAFASQQRIVRLYAETQKGPRKECIKQSWFSGLGLFTSQFVTTAAISLAYWYGGREMNKGLVTAKQMFQVFFILMTTGKNIADAGSMSSDLSKGGGAVKSVLAVLDRKTEIDPDDSEGLKVRRINGHIELMNVHFSYPSRPEQMIFQGLSLKIEAGRTVALVGQSGSGKSTIIGLIERFYDPIKGCILVDARDLKNYNLRHLRSHIALVSQEPTLFAGSIRHNIIYGKEEASEAEIMKAAKLANAHEFISSMNDGYETYCGERGVQLSGGQKQRVALARAILKNPAILLLDEATSALDSASENLVQEALEKMMVGRTCVVVAHRLSTIQKSDSIAVIENGKVAEQGSHSELLSMGNMGSYHSLIKLQHI
ncbi:putative multidrug resistance protein [Cynara cardunculus var. scolymus]|uniref:putative multidrug resistance protein n=1 Tax=Cynara cardunculus var. scolymus TaxID=59895 RepID=UPI000D629CF0|nr:putative multidrug resistance protein [Cynara cardunculus var. scolymus]